MANKKEAEVVVLPEQKVDEISKDIKSFGKKLEGFLAPSTPEQYTKTVAFAQEVKGRINRVKEIVDFFVKPHQEARARALDEMKKIEALFAPTLNSYLEMERSLKGAVSTYHAEQERLAREEEDRLRREREKKEAKTGKPSLAPLPTVERVAPTMKTETGKTTAKKVWKFEVVNLAELRKDKAFMDLFWNAVVEKGIHDSIIRNMVRAGVREIGGVRIYEDFDVSISA
jgi:hypothetical protein